MGHGREQGAGPLAIFRNMTKLLEEALRAVAKLPDAEQDALASAILAEVAGDAAWGDRFRASADELEHLANEAIEEHRQGRSQPLDPDAL